jgi:hypothetical protein
MARQEDRQSQVPARRQEGRLTRSPGGWGQEEDWFNASPYQMMRRMHEDIESKSMRRA